MAAAARATCPEFPGVGNDRASLAAVTHQPEVEFAARPLVEYNNVYEAVI